MTVRLTHKQGDTFLVDCTAYADLDQTSPRDLTNITVTAEMHAPMRDPYELTVEVTDAVNGAFRLEAPAQDTENWGSRIWYASITYTYNTTGIVSSTEVFQILVQNNFNNDLG